MKSIKREMVVLIVLSFSITMLLPTKVLSQENSMPSFETSTWIDFGLGRSTRERALLLSFNAELKKRTLLTLSFDRAYYPKDYSYRFLSTGATSRDIKDGFDTKAFNLKLGKLYKRKWGIFSFSAGASIVGATKSILTQKYVDYTYVFFIPIYDPHYETVITEEKSSTIGFSMDVRIMPAIKFIGLSVNPFFNLNKIHSYGGLTINLALGKVHY